MSNYAHELFLLSTNLSQFKSKVLITKIFIESINSIFVDHGFSWNENIGENTLEQMQVCTRTKTYGFISYNNQAKFTDETFSLLQNAVQLLAILFEKLEQEALLNDQKEHLKLLVEEKTKDLLESQNEIEKQNKELRERNIFIQTILDNLPISVALNSFDKSEATYINKKFEEIYGWHAEQIISIPDFFIKIYPDEEYRNNIIERIMNDINSGDQSRMHWENIQITTSNGTQKIVNAVNIPLLEQNTMVSTVMDMTELYNIQSELIRAKEKAEENENYFRSIFENSPVGKSITATDGTIKTNKAFSDMLGYSFDEFQSKKFTDITHPEDIQLSKNAINELVEGKYSTCQFEKRYVHKNGSVIYTDVRTTIQKDSKGNPLFFITNIINITERKKAEQKIKESHELLLLFIKHSPIYTYIKEVTDTESKVIYVSDNYIDMIGISASEMIGKTMQELFPLDFAKKIAADDWKVITDKEILKIDEKLNNKYYITLKFPISLNNKHLLAGYTIDITERKKTELLLEEKNNEIAAQNEEYLQINEELNQTNQALFEAKEKAEESDQLKTAFLQNMSHEIRTPMNAIIGFTGFLDNPDLSVEKRKSFVSIIQNSTNQLLSIITVILSISSIETNQAKVCIEKVCINNIIIDLLAIFKIQAQNHNISLYAKQQLTDKQSEIFTDQTKVTQILTNLITNALKFTHEGFIEFGYNLVEPLHATALPELQFYVKDSGIGIKTEMQEKIFERFRQANENINKQYGGTGLGLAISKAFAELLGGRIWAQSKLEKGSTFYFTIPYKPVYEIENANTQTAETNNNVTILIAEDEEYNFLYLEELLNNAAIKLIHTKDGKETVDYCRQNTDIALILMDIKMPIMTGHEAAKQIKEFRPDLIIIAQSAYALEHEREKYSGTAFDDYVTKPINKDKLKQILTKYIDKQINKWL